MSEACLTALFYTDNILESSDANKIDRIISSKIITSL